MLEVDINNREIPSLKELNNKAAGTVVILSVVSVKDQGDMVKSSQIVVRSPGELNEKELIRLENRLREEITGIGLDEKGSDWDTKQGWVLSPRLREALELAREGLVNKEIAEQMGIGEQTVKNMLAQCLQKLEAKNRVHAVIQAIRLREIKLGRGDRCQTVQL